MHRTPASTSFSSDVKSVQVLTDRREQLQRIIAIAQTDIDYVQAIQLDRVIRQLPTDVFAELPRCRLALLSSSTVDHLIPPLTVAGIRCGIFLDVYATPFNQYRQELLDPSSALAKFGPQVVLFSLSGRETISNVPIAAPLEEIDNLLSSCIDAVAGLWEAARQLGVASVLQQTYLNVGPQLFGSLDRSLPAAPSNVLRQMNQRLVNSAQANDVAILDLDRAVEKEGLRFWFDKTRWLQAKMEIAPTAAIHYSDLVARIIAAQLGRSRKCLVVDLDNTLWGGVVGDDGIEGITVGEGTALGEAFLDFQRYLKQLKGRGIILAVCSKNDQETAQSVFRDHPEMYLKLEDITIFMANWENKATNLLRIAQELNIGLDSLVFFDDNPAERALVRQALPSVAVPELPEDASGYVDCLDEAGYFEAIAFTGEDAYRSDQYAANVRRKKLEATAQSIDDYLASLTMTMRALPFQEVDIPRITQLINKTNQFNTTTRRRTAEEIRSTVCNAQNLTLQVRLTDRFGDTGLVSAVIMMPCPKTPGSYEIETWVMSCRVFGRQLEYEIMNSIVQIASEAGADRVVASHIPTPKNGPTKDLYEKLGFQKIDGCESSLPGETRWTLNLKLFEPHPTHIETTVE